MNHFDAMKAVGGRSRATAYTAQRTVHAAGRVVAYSEYPMVLIETAEGERVWWRRDLVHLDETENA